MIFNYFFCLTSIFGIIIGTFFFLNVYSGSCPCSDPPNIPVNLKVGTNCKVLKTVNSCFKRRVETPWDSEGSEYDVLQHYISTGYEVGQEFFFTTDSPSSIQGGHKKAFKGSHENPKTGETQNLVIKYFLPNEATNSKKKRVELFLSELLIHAKWTLATYQILGMEENLEKDFIWVQPIIAYCPNLFPEQSNIAIIEPTINFQRYIEGDKQYKEWKSFQEVVRNEFGFEGKDQQGFDCHDFGEQFENNICVMTDVDIEDKITEDAFSKFKKKYTNFIKNNFGPESAKCSGGLDLNKYCMNEN